MECQNIIEFIKLVTPFICYISSLLKYENIDTYVEDDKIIIVKLEFQDSQGEYMLDMLKINDDNGIESIRECIEYFNEAGFYLSFTKKFDAYFIISNYPEDKNTYNQHINTNKKFRTEECIICDDNIPNVIFCGCGHLCICEDCIKTYQNYKCPVCKHIDKNIRVII